MDTYMLDRPAWGPGVETVAAHHLLTRSALTEPRIVRAAVDRTCTRLVDILEDRRLTLLTSPTVHIGDAGYLADRDLVGVMAEAIVLDRYWPGQPWPTLDPFPRSTRILNRIRRIRIARIAHHRPRTAP